MNARKSNPHTLHSRFTGPDALHEAVAATQGFCEACALSPGDAARLVIIIEELVTNVYEHGGMDDADTLSLSLERNDATVLIVLCDNGRAFDPRTPDTEAMPERGGGAGLNLVRSWAEILRYHRGKDYNLLQIRLALRE